jgi:hypothetical protein
MFLFESDPLMETLRATGVVVVVIVAAVCVLAILAGIRGGGRRG